MAQSVVFPDFYDDWLSLNFLIHSNLVLFCQRNLKFCEGVYSTTGPLPYVTWKQSELKVEKLKLKQILLKMLNFLE